MLKVQKKSSLKIIAIAVWGALAMGPSITHAHSTEDEGSRPEHYKGEVSESITEALANLSEYNQKLDMLLQKESMTPEDMNEVHKLTYTLENAVQTMQSELTRLAGHLEEVHLGSERVDEKRVKTNGAIYLNDMKALHMPSKGE